MGLTFKSLIWVKQATFPNVGGPHAISWKPDYNKMADLSQSKREFLLSDYLWTGTLAFSYPWTSTEILALPVSQACWPSDENYTIDYPISQAFELNLELHYWPSWVSIASAHSTDLGSFSVHKLMRRFLTISLSLSFSLSAFLSVPLFLSLSSPSFYIYRYRYTITHIHTLHYTYLLVLFLWITLINTDSELNKWSRRQNSDRGPAGFSIWTCNLYASFLLLCHFYNNYHYC